MILYQQVLKENPIPLCTLYLDRRLNLGEKGFGHFELQEDENKGANKEGNTGKHFVTKVRFTISYN